MNILNIIRTLILEDEFLKAELDNRIYFYETSKNADITNSFVILTPIYDEPNTIVSNNYLAEEYLIQVDVETYHHQKTIDNVGK